MYVYKNCIFLDTTKSGPLEFVQSWCIIHTHTYIYTDSTIYKKTISISRVVRIRARD